jgi:hypothetical protein
VNHALDVPPQVEVAKQEQEVLEDTKASAHRPCSSDVLLQEMQGADYVHSPHAWTPLEEGEEDHTHLTSLA